MHIIHIRSAACVKCGVVSGLLFFSQCMRPCVIFWSIPLLKMARTFVVNHIIIKSKVWTFRHCFWLCNNTTACMFIAVLWGNFSDIRFAALITMIKRDHRNNCNSRAHAGVRIKLINSLRPRQMDAISQTTFWNEFSWMKMHEYRLKCHWSLFPRAQLIISQHWFR